MPVHLALAEADLQEPCGDAMSRQEQGIGQLIDGADHGADDEAGSEPGGGAIAPILIMLIEKVDNRLDRSDRRWNNLAIEVELGRRFAG
jgi:hypothetical protein